MNTIETARLMDVLFFFFLISLYIIWCKSRELRQIMEIQSLSDIACLLLSLFGIIFLIPFAMYAIYQYYIYRHQIYFTKRHLWSLNISCILYFILITSLFPQPVLYIFDEVKANHAPFSVPFRINTSCLFFYVVLTTVRTWLLYFDHGYHNALLNQKWIQELNPNEESINNFFVGHKQTYGNIKWISKVVLTIILLLIMLLNILNLPIFDLGLLVYSGLALIGIIVVIILCIIWYKLSNELSIDTLHIRRELKVIAFSTLICNILLFILAMIFQFVPLKNNWEYKNNASHYTQWDKYILWIQWFIQYFWLLIVIYFTTIDVIAMNQDPNDYGSGNEYGSGSDRRNGRNGGGYKKSSIYLSPSFPVFKNSTREKSTISQSGNSEHESTRWQYFIKTKNGYHEWMVFLCKEFSVENMLFLTEYTQFARALNLTPSQVCYIIIVQLQYFVLFKDSNHSLDCFSYFNLLCRFCCFFGMSQTATVV